MKRIIPLFLALLLLAGCSSKDLAYMAPIQAYCEALENNDFSRMQEAMPAAVLNSEGMNAGELEELRRVFFADAGTEYTLEARPLKAEDFSIEDCQRLQAFLLEEYGCRLEVAEAKRLRLRLDLGGELKGDVEFYAVVYSDGTQWYVDFNTGVLETKGA